MTLPIEFPSVKIAFYISLLLYRITTPIPKIMDMKIIIPHSPRVGMSAASMGSQMSVSSLQVVSVGQGLVPGRQVQFGASQVSTPLQNRSSLQSRSVVQGHI